MEVYRNTTIHRAALKIADKGKPVFPCRKNKSPHTPRGFKDATTSPSKVTAFWTRYPDAQIGMPTGSRSGVFVVDVDRLEALGELPQELPETLTFRTPSGGLHYAYKHVDGITNRNGALPDGIDIRGEGGYIIVPPSEGYQVELHAPVAYAPDWLLELLRENPVCSSNHGSGVVTTDVDGPVIPKGTRDETLTRIAGRLHDGTRALADLAADLQAINAARCTPPLPQAQVWKIAKSIYNREPCSPGPSPKALEALADIEAAFWQTEWRGMGGKSERDVVAALIKLARKHGRAVDDGVKVSMSVRALALAAAVSKRSLLDYYKHGARKPGIISRLKQVGVIRSTDNADSSGTKSGGFVLLNPSAGFHHSNHQGFRGGNTASGETLRAPFSAPRLRWSAPRFDRVGDEVVRSTIKRLGKTAGAVVDVLEAAGGSATIYEIAKMLAVKRPRDLRRRVISRLEEAAVVECSGDDVVLATDWLEALDRDRERGEEISAFRRDMAAYNREREAYRNRHKHRPDRAPTEAEMDADRRARHARRVAMALQAFKAASGARVNLKLFADGDLHKVEYLCKAVLHYHGVPFEKWGEWVAPALEAGRAVVGELSEPKGVA